MATNHGHGNGGEPRNLSVGFDKSDLSARGILVFFIVLALFAVAMHIAVLGLYVGMTKISERHEAEVSPLAPRTVTPRSEILTNTADVNVQKFPEPRLQEDEPGDMTRFLVKEDAALTAAPYQDSAGNVHLPIDQAMKAVLPRLPVRAGNQPALPNYPGASRQYSYPPMEAGNESSAIGTEPSPTLNQQGNTEQTR